jgi:hypothetical protein
MTRRVLLVVGIALGLSGCPYMAAFESMDAAAKMNHMRMLAEHAEFCRQYAAIYPQECGQ